jgi:hypothetical protein
MILRYPELTLWRIGDAGAPPLGSLDPVVLNWCDRANCILVTNNRKSMPVHLREHLAGGGHVPGIFVVSLEMTLAQTAEQLATIALASFEDEHQDMIQFLPLF